MSSTQHAQAQTQGTPVTPGNVAQLTLRNPIPTVGEVRQVLWTPDGRRMVVVGVNGYWLFNSVETPNFNAPRAYSEVYKRGRGEIRYTTITPDSRFIAFAFSTEVNVYELESGAQVSHFDAYTRVDSPAFSPDSNILAIPVLNSIRLWNFHTQTRPAIVELGTRNVYAAAFSADGKWLATSGIDHLELRAVRNGVVDRETTKVLAVTRGVNDIYGQIVFTPDSQQLIVKFNFQVGWWDVASGKAIPFPEPMRNVDALAINSSGSLLAIGQNTQTGTVTLVDTALRKRSVVLQGATRLGGKIAFSPDGRTLAVVYSRWVSLWDLTAQKISEARYDTASNISRVALDSSGRVLITTGEYSNLFVWDTATMRHSFSKNAASKIALSPDGTLLALVSREAQDTVIVWDTATNRIKYRLTHIANYLAGIQFSADSRQLFTVDGLAVLRKWDISTGQATPITLTPKAARTNLVTFSADSRFFAFILAPENQTAIVYIYDANTGKQLSSFTATPAIASEFLFSPDNRYLLTRSRETNELWDTATGTLVYSIKQDAGFDSLVVSGMRWSLLAAFSTDNRLLAFAYNDGSIVFRELPTGAIVHTMNTTGLPVQTIAFSSDGTQLITAHAGGIVRFWEVR